MKPELAKLCGEAIQEDLREIRAEVLAEAAETREDDHSRLKRHGSNEFSGAGSGEFSHSMQAIVAGPKCQCLQSITKKPANAYQP
ncbi:unnamed protein product [Heligmosomoides polygyrus]|uniref:Transposase n=1 Tax=Heligmosomoides polygyrus TaxID=6339 RepID=A0A183FBR3_HELPZ|nr:unnamed protein product [Heligmosomoides polygyrus]